MGQRLLTITLAAGLAACASSGEVGLSPLSRGVPEESRPETLCASLVYDLTCVPPRGFDLAEERPGPGLVMRYSSREATPAERSHIIMRAYPLSRRKLSWIVDENIIKPLRHAHGMGKIGIHEAALGPRRGLAIAVRREGETWAFMQFFFAFAERDTVFVVEHTVPAPRAKSERGKLEGFIDSIAFR